MGQYSIWDTDGSGTQSTREIIDEAADAARNNKGNSAKSNNTLTNILETLVGKPVVGTLATPEGRNDLKDGINRILDAAIDSTNEANGKNPWSFRPGLNGSNGSDLFKFLLGNQDGAAKDLIDGRQPVIVRRNNENGELEFEDQSLEDARDMINQQAQANNEWSAHQAELNRQFQLYMSNTAHQREIADLQAAGLNPVLSAGGQGASTGSGSMGQTDTSNTSLIGELAMRAIDGLADSAHGLSQAANNEELSSIFGKLTYLYNNNKLISTTYNNLTRGLSMGFARSLFNKAPVRNNYYTTKYY